MPQNIEINEYTIELINEKQSPYNPMYTSSLVKWEVLKAYIKIQLKIHYIQPWKSLAKAYIFCDKRWRATFSYILIIEALIT